MISSMDLTPLYLYSLIVHVCACMHECVYVYECCGVHSEVRVSSCGSQGLNSGHTGLGSEYLYPLSYFVNPFL